MARESKARKRERATDACARIAALFPDAETALDHTDAFTLTIAVLLSAQTTDVQVNKVTPELFRRWPDAASMAQADPLDVGEVIRSIGFFNTKARHAVEASQRIVAKYGGEVPATMEDLLTLPGVGRKTANIVLNNAFGIVEGIAVDTHVYRIAKRLELTRAATPAAAEKDLLDTIPHELWGDVNITWVLFGRQVCDAKKPRCADCPLIDICPGKVV